MIFPRPVKKIGECICIVTLASSRSKAGKTILRGKRIRYKGKIWSISRLSFHLNCHSIRRTPANLRKGLILHTCDRGWCINPKHLYYGNASQNSKDKWDRNAEFRINVIASYKAAAKRRCVRPSERRRLKKQIREFFAKPRNRKTHSVTMKKKWQEPEYRAQMIHARRNRRK